MPPEHPTLEIQLNSNRSGKWTGFVLRDVAEEAESYSEAKKILLTQKLLAPAYYILGGNSTGEGVIITRSLEKTVDIQVSSSI